MATTNTHSGTAHSATLKGYEDKINAQMKEARARLDQLEAKAREHSAKAEITAINGLKTAKQAIDRKLQDLKSTHDTHMERAKATIDADVATFRASIDDFATKLRTHSTDE
jgi:hypothetical protein